MINVEKAHDSTGVGIMVGICCTRVPEVPALGLRRWRLASYHASKTKEAVSHSPRARPPAFIARLLGAPSAVRPVFSQRRRQMAGIVPKGPLELAATAAALLIGGCTLYQTACCCICAAPPAAQDLKPSRRWAKGERKKKEAAAAAAAAKKKKKKKDAKKTKTLTRPTAARSSPRSSPRKYTHAPPTAICFPAEVPLTACLWLQETHRKRAQNLCAGAAPSHHPRADSLSQSRSPSPSPSLSGDLPRRRNLQRRPQV